MKLYQRSLAADTGGAFTSMDPGIRGWKTLHNLALSHLALGDWPSARSAWKAAIDGEGRVEAARALFSSAIDHNDLKVAGETLEWVRAHQGETGMWPGMVGALCEAAGLDPVPHWEGALLQNHSNDEARRLLAKRHLITGQEQQAVLHLDILQHRGHAEGALLLAQLTGEIYKGQNDGDRGQ